MYCEENTIGDGIEVSSYLRIGSQGGQIEEVTFELRSECTVTGNHGRRDPQEG